MNANESDAERQGDTNGNSGFETAAVSNFYFYCRFIRPIQQWRRRLQLRLRWCTRWIRWGLFRP